MIEFSKIKHPLIRDGRSQEQRQVQALDPAQAPVDDRSMEDLLNYIYHYAKQIHYYNEENKIEGNWQSFFALNDPFQMAIISRFDIVGIRADYLRLSTSLENNVLPQHLLPLLDRIFELAIKINEWSQSLQRDTPLQRTIRNIIDSNLQYTLKESIAIANAAFAKQWIKNKYNLDVFQKNSLWKLNVTDRIQLDNGILSLKGSTEKQLLRTRKKLDEVFDTFNKAFTQIVSDAPAALHELINDVENQGHTPHITLLLAFLRLFENSRDDLNTITKRHLDFFYKRVLQLKEDKAELDFAHLVFELNPNTLQHELKKGTQFSAGEDDLGVEMIFENKEAVVLSRAQVASLKTLHLNPAIYKKTGVGKLDKDKIPKLIESVYAAPIANSSDGKGADFLDPKQPNWATLGQAISKCPAEDNPKEMKKMPDALLGFALASNVLLLNEGKRTITITLKCTFPPETDMDKLKEKINTQFVYNDEVEGLLLENGYLQDNAGTLSNKFLSSRSVTEFEYDVLGETEEDFVLVNQFIKREHPFRIYFSGAEAWLEPYDISMTQEEVEGEEAIVLTVNLDPTMDPITFYNAAVLGTKFNTGFPMTRIELKPEAKIDFENSKITSEVSMYQIFRDTIINNIKIETKVEGVKNLVLQNDESILDPSKPFLPFGTLPNNGANFFIGSAEIFSKKVTDFTATITWDKLPTTFKEHYEMYFKSDGISSKVNFLANLKLLKGGIWTNSLGSKDLFLKENQALVADGLIEHETILESGFEGTTLFPYTPESLNGFIKLELNQQDGFKQNLYGETLSRQAIAIAEKSKDTPVIVGTALYKKSAGVIVFGSTLDATTILTHTPELPKDPYTPTIKEFSVTYTALAEGNKITFFHLYPYEHTFLQKSRTGSTLLPKFEDEEPGESLLVEKEGQLFIGLDNFIPNSIIHILFQVAESTANPELDKAEVTWHYLSSNQWKPLKEDFNVLADDTDGLIRSGIITIEIPSDINQNNTILSPDYHWIKASVPKHSSAVSEIIDVHTQAVKVCFKDQNNDLTRLVQPLAAGSIGELVANDSRIAGFSQLYDSFGGVSAETSTHFYTRVSEHLRHKGRGITLYDYERLVLQAFPELYKVKCIPHTLGRKIQFPFKEKDLKDNEDRDYEMSPGFVTVAVIPNLSKLKFKNQLQPKVTLGKLEEIKDYLQKRISPFIRLQVLNPRYEPIHVSTKVVFKKGKSRSFYEEKLKEDILEFLTPWAFNQPSRISFGGKVYKSSILNFVEQRDYVDYVFDFVIKDQTQKAKNEIAAQSARSILVSGNHKIESSDSCDLTNKSRIEGVGVGFEKIGTFLPSDDPPCDENVTH